MLDAVLHAKPHQNREARQRHVEESSESRNVVPLVYRTRLPQLIRQLFHLLHYQSGWYRSHNLFTHPWLLDNGKKYLASSDSTDSRTLEKIR